MITVSNSPYDLKKLAMLVYKRWEKTLNLENLEKDFLPNSQQKKMLFIFVCQIFSFRVDLGGASLKTKILFLRIFTFTEKNNAVSILDFGVVTEMLE